MALKRYRYRIYPDTDQRLALARAFGCARVVFNDAVAAREQAREAGLPAPTANDLSKRLITQAKRTPEREWLAAVSAGVLQQALADADRAYRNFFSSLSGKRKGRRVGQPRFRSRRDTRQSIRFTRNTRFSVRKLSHDHARLRLGHVPGTIRMALSRDLPTEPSSVTIIRESDGRYFASFVVDTGVVAAAPVVPQSVALDMGLDVFAATVRTDGSRDKQPNPRHLRAGERKLAKAQRKLVRKEVGSNNRTKAGSE